MPLFINIKIIETFVVLISAFGYSISTGSGFNKNS